MIDRETGGDEVRPPRGPLGKLVLGLRILNARLRFIYLMIATGLVIGYWDTILNYWDRWTRPAAAPDTLARAEAVEYFCPMHPNVVREAPGKCPICGMPLSKRKKGTAVELPGGVLSRVQLSPERIAQAGVATGVVEYRLLTRDVRALGIVDYDERRLARIAARTGGRIDELFIDFTGTRVKKGQPLVKLYSPELVSGQQELLVAIRGAGLTGAAGSTGGLDWRGTLVESARRRLLLWGISEEQIARIAREGRAVTHLDILSPIDGTVIERNVLEGQYVETGSVLYAVADLSAVWLFAEIYETDVSWLELGQPVEVTTEAYPGEVFVGHISFLDPMLQKETRTLRARIEIPNADERLKPGMYATAVIRIPLGEMHELDSDRGREALKEARRDAGSIYVCPMHPEERSGKPGRCGKCHMALEKKAAPSGGFACPMHPEVRSPGPGDCSKCGMKLEAIRTHEARRYSLACSLHPDVEPDETGYCGKCGGRMQVSPAPPATAVAGFCCPVHPDDVRKEGGDCPVCRTECRAVVMEKTLAVPAGAVIDTGTKRVVYVESSPGVFDAREAGLGPRTGEWYPVREGLEPGMRVVTAGAFLVDAEARLSPGAGAAYFGAAGGPSGGRREETTVRSGASGKPDAAEGETAPAGSAHSGSSTGGHRHD